MNQLTLADSTMNPQCRPPLSRVLYVTDLDPSLKFGSLEEQVLLLACEFKAHGSLLLPLFQAPLGSEVATEFRAHGVDAEWADLTRFSLATVRRVIGLLRHHEIAIVHWNLYHPLSPYVWMITLLRPDLRFFLTDHNSRGLDEHGKPVSSSTNRVINSIKRILLTRYTKILCVSNFVLSCVENQGVWSNASLCTHFINTDRFTPSLKARSRIRSSLGIDNNFVILLVAHLVRAKGVNVALKALMDLPDRTILLVLGDGEEASVLKGETTHHSLESKVRFFGWQSNVHEYMQAADCLVVPSLWQEAAGLVILEGLASGLPVIGSAVGAIPEFIEDGKTGFLFPPGDHTQLAEIIRHMQRNPNVCSEIGQRARAKAVACFSPRARLPQYLDLYRHSAW